ncbi:hypothetical protein Tco_0909168 [Tanacetum coccineum]|uniref:Uncharacterized protein n=1 Tax=Tanacetum coccineum TaxID=301880 RepID=A0ABQ5CRC6_9ASTR
MCLTSLLMTRRSDESDMEFEEDPQEEPEEEPEEDPQEEPEEEFKEDPEEDPEEELEVDAEEDAPPAATPPVGSHITPPPLFESSSETLRLVASGALEMPPPGSTFEVGGPSNVNYLEICEKKRQAEIDANNYGIRKIGKRMDALDRDLSHEVQFVVLREG